MIPVNYHHLYYFWVTAKSGSITEGARRLYLAQPTLSLQLKQLENQLGARLLHRRRTGVSLTPEGQRALEYCERIFSQGEALVRTLKGEEGAPAILRLGFSTSLSRQVVLRAVDELESSGALVLTQIVTAQIGELRERLAKFSLDAALVDVDLAPSLGQAYRSRLVASLPVQLVASPELKRKLGAGGLKGRTVPILVRPQDHPLRREFEAALRRAGAVPQVAAETDDADLIRILAARGKGVGALSRWAVEDGFSAGRLETLKTKSAGLVERAWLVAPAETNGNARLQSALDALWRWKPRV
jgi:LysR family transcriptional activator of nhaA